MLQLILIFFGLIMTLPTIILWLSTALILFLIGKLTKNEIIKRLGLNLAISLDQLSNVLLLGDCEETISSRIGRAMLSGRPKWWVPYLSKIVDWLAFNLFKDENHCIGNIEHGLALNYELWSWIK